MKVEQVHVKHSTWHTKVTVGKGKKERTFGLQTLADGKHRLHIPFGQPTKHKDFDSREEALAYCESLV